MIVGLTDLCKFDIVLGTLCESLVLRSGLKSCVGGLYITLAGSDDGFQVVLAGALCVTENIRCGVKVAVQDVDKSLVE